MGDYSVDQMLTMLIQAVRTCQDEFLSLQAESDRQLTNCSLRPGYTVPTSVMSGFNQRCKRQSERMNRLLNDLGAVALLQPLAMDEYLASQMTSSQEVTAIPEGDLEYKEVLGEGAFGLVYSGKLLGLDVAIKVLKAEMDDELMEEVQREVDFMCLNRHPNIVSVLGMSTLEGAPVIVTEMLQGSFLNLLRNQDVSLTMRDYVELFFGAARGMAWLHRPDRQLIHRDIKADNFLYARQGLEWTVRVADFGLSTWNLPGVEVTAAGTVYYFAPEVVRLKFRMKSTHPYSLSSDVYAFGCMMYEMLLRKKFKNCREMKQVRTQEALTEFLIVKDLRPTITEEDRLQYGELFEVVDRCWKTEPSERGTFQEIVEVLSGLRVTSVLSCSVARAFWTKNFGTASSVQWRKFMECLLPILRAEKVPLPVVRSSTKRGVAAPKVSGAEENTLQALKVLRQMVEVNGTVLLERFAQLINTFGPLSQPGGGWKTFLGEILDGILRRYFFGSLTEDATRSLMHGSHSGFLLRFSNSSPSDLVFVFNHPKKGKLVQMKVLHCPDGYSVQTNSSAEPQVWSKISDMVSDLKVAYGLKEPVSPCPFLLPPSSGYGYIC